MTRIFRVAPAAHPEFDGAGAARHPGRWNHRDIPIVYTSEHLAVAMLETLANSGELPENRVWREAQVPDGVAIEEANELQEDWDSEKATTATKDTGTKWANSLRSAVLRVPCALVPRAFNYLVNPRHPDSAKITARAAEPLRFDTRLK